MPTQIIIVDVAVKPDYNFALEFAIKEYKRLNKNKLLFNVHFVLVDVVVKEGTKSINYRYRFNVIPGR